MTDTLRTLIAPNPSPMTLDGTRTFIVGVERPAVIDPGPRNERHLAAILAALGGRAPAAILLTHGHADHAELAEPLARETGVPVARVREGEAVRTDAGDLHVLATPGHAPDHVAFHWREQGAVFVGDTFMGEGDTTLVAPPEGDLAAYLRSLDRIAALSPSILYPAHGPPIADGAEAIVRYRRHREERIAQVVRALRRAGPSLPREILDEVYGPTLLPALRGAAEGSLHAILGYLDAEGLARALPDGRFTLTA
ncbi:MAG TPA: MBL fold metallo-hydrolase [Longimicrobiaceae bacterium]|nr:MBL fold metallo-hydrolase [Longimicrobiaceae bacterium]